jgi:hypothetical protein
MTLESLGPLVDALCAVLQGKGCVVREVSVTYAPWAVEDVPDLDSSSSRVDTSGSLSVPPGDSRCHESSLGGALHRRLWRAEPRGPLLLGHRWRRSGGPRA